MEKEAEIIKDMDQFPKNHQIMEKEAKIIKYMDQFPKNHLVI